MNTIFLELKSIDDRTVELRYRVLGQVRYESRNLPLAEIAGLYNFADSLPETLRERDFAKNNSSLAKIGQQLFAWLDGAERWLSRSIQQRGLLVLAIDAQGGLGGLPWEILYYEGFLVARSIVPIRVVGGFERPRAARKLSEYQLRALFMATDPIDVQPKLNFEEEEALILEATRELAMELRVEESGCIDELQSFWRRYVDRFDVFHLSGHADIKDGVPFFITESLEGDRVESKIEDFAEAFNLRYPPLIFLSGCRTSENIQQGVSLAEGLVAQGAPAVLGWSRSVRHIEASAAAMVLYRSLAEGFSLAEALALTYQGLIKTEVPDWCLLRLYAECGAWGELVLPPGDAVPVQLPEASTEFLDPLGLVKVVGKDGFVGRRRYLQQGLRALRSPQYVGIWLHGLGGVGKSTIASRLLDRLSSSYNRLVISGVFDAAKLEYLLGRQCENLAGQEILQGDLPLAQKLAQFLKRGLNEPNQRLVFVLDDFEQNIELRGDGEQVLKAAVVEVLTGLFEGITLSKLPHKVIVTSRYDVVLPAVFNRKVQRFAVERMDRSDVAKLSDRLESFASNSEVATDLQARALSIADGYPRLLEWLNKVLSDDLTDGEAILAAMAGKQQEFLTNILVEQLLAQQQPELGEVLRRGTIFELPVPLAALRAICTDLVGFEQYVVRARALGLLESGLQVDVVRVPRVLNLATVSEPGGLEAIGVKVLYREWIEQATTSSEEQCLEIHRLAMWGGDGEIAVEMAQRLSNRWIYLSRFRAAQNICEATLFLQKDGLLIYNLSHIYRTLGDMAKALDYCQQSIKIYREIDNRKGEADSLHQLSIIYNNLGDYPQALSLSQQSSEIYKEIGDKQGEAASLHQLSMIYKNLGDYSQALSLSQQLIEIDREIGNRKGEATSLHQLSIIYNDLGNYSQALSLSQQSIKIFKESGNRQGEAASLHVLSMTYYNLGNYPQALSLCEQSIKIQKEIGNRQGEAASLHQLSMIYSSSGDYPQALSLSQQSIKIYREIGDRQGAALSLHQLSTIHYNLCDYPQALSLSQQSIRIYKEIGDRQGEAFSLHQLSIIYDNLGDFPQSLKLSQQSIKIKKEIGDRQGEAVSLAQMATIARQQGDTVQERKLRLEAAVIRGSIGDYGGLIITLKNLGADKKPDALGYLAQSLWLTVHCDTNLKSAINLISTIYQRVPAGDSLKPLLAATALYFCQTRSHPELPQLKELSNQIITHAAQQQDIITQTNIEQWFITEHLNDPEYFLPALLQGLTAIIGDNWLFDTTAFTAQKSI